VCPGGAAALVVSGTPQVRVVEKAKVRSSGDPTIPRFENRRSSGSVLKMFFSRSGIDLWSALAGLFQRGLVQLALHALGFLHFAFFQALHFFLALLKCCSQGFSSLPAGFAGLPRRFAVILVGKAVPAAALATLVVAAA
jgi:hypothetical protein